ncbi:putative pyoverdine/dityrosine biosynthesis protein [Zopfia rhizophila CBS 207.26]|uniref:Putative pyoverdine/dityrosine biosynthesis protein n=1 Tax=Zopfia rhizophila CBS 207.26 TaxID=1314779 RepID=A0A6A6EYR7_9PEZI|nr:putative pyoverdine/dityrosine biosynthesis protein [Zopfia rhizophila CBS 207.26]
MSPTDRTVSPIHDQVKTPVLPEAPALSGVNNGVCLPEDKHLNKAKEILHIIESYSVNFQESKTAWEGFEVFLPLVRQKVSNSQPVRMILPAFPMKSPNRKDKVLGRLPDFGEELALLHLNGLCDNIRDIYEPGAELLIQSDGLVYNDILGVSDADVWDYGESLRHMASEKHLAHLRFVRLWDLLQHPGPDDESLARDLYLSHAPCLRRELIYRYEPENLNVDQAIRNEEDTCLTYRGYLKFLTRDLAYHPNMIEASKKGAEKLIAQTARQMIGRGKAFAAAIKCRFPDCVRLSIHESVGKGKLSISLVPQPKGSGIAPTPWHSAVAVCLDGTYLTVFPEEVKDTHDLVYKAGRPYFYREKADMFRWPFPVKIEHQYPCGVIITPTDTDHIHPPPSIREIPMQKVRTLSNHFSPVVLRGFSHTLDESMYVEKAHELGKVLPWSFGITQKVKDSGRTDKMGNNVTSNEAMPMHFDGIFKFEDREHPVTGEVKRVQIPPGYQYFTCPATAPRGTGFTLFASSRLFFRYLPEPFSVDRLEKTRWAMDNNGFWNAKLGDLPLVVRHPVDNSPCLRWHQPWDETKTKFSTCIVTIENDTQEIVELINQLVYDRRACLYFTWEVGDLLVSDNTAMLHTRTSYKTNCDRELWRIHVD